MLAESWSKAAQRSAAAVHAYVGPNGAGKTAAAVHDCLLSLREGRPVLSSVPLLDWEALCSSCGSTPCVEACESPSRPPHPLWVPFTSLELLLEFRGGDVLMDEVQGIASAREHQGLPYQVANALRKLRHSDVRLRWTAPDWMAADAVIRRVSTAVTVCSGHFGRQHVMTCPGCQQRHTGPNKSCDLPGRVRLWRDNRLLRWRTFDATKFEEFNLNRVETQQKKVKLKPFCRQAYWRPSGVVQRAYDTYGEVISLGAADMSGVCIACGGVKKRKPCSCPDQQPVESPVSLRDFKKSGALAEVVDAGSPGAQREARAAGVRRARRPRAVGESTTGNTASDDRNDLLADE